MAMAHTIPADTGHRALAARLVGRVLTPADSDYDDARSIWNGALDRRPAVIARCASGADVAAAIQFGRDQGLEISVRGGGHNFAGTAACPDGLMISLAAMTQVSVDSARRTVVCGGGATWAQVDAATQAHGLAVPGGVISHTGVGGLTLGGGFGWLTSKAGLSCDNLLNAEVVTADGAILGASADENPDLYWAIGGGGGNFGVVTSLQYRLHEVGPLVHVGLFFWGLEGGTEGLRFSRDFVEGLPAGTGVMIAGLNAPPAPFVPEEHRFRPGYALVIVSFGTAEEHVEAVEPVRQASPLFELVTSMPYVNVQQMFDESAPWGILGYEKALWLDDLTDDVIRVFTEYLPKKNSPLSFIPVQLLDGAYTKATDAETAFGGARKRLWSFSIAGLTPTHDLFEAERAWVRSFWEALRPHAQNVGGYVNFMADIQEDRVRAAYGEAKYARLAKIKAIHDPDNIFHMNANITPATT
jgi:hypothetical protein